MYEAWIWFGLSIVTESYKFPTAIRTPLENGCTYFIPLVSYGFARTCACEWCGSYIDINLMKLGQVYLDPEDARTHAEVWIKISKPVFSL